MDAPKHGLPVTIITGFLGSGKTTLLNHILSNQEGLKTAVLVNEFGEIGIDHELIVATEDNMVELSNGCICCTINDDLLDAVYSVLERPEKIDYLVVETTGLADPALHPCLVGLPRGRGRDHQIGGFRQAGHGHIGLNLERYQAAHFLVTMALQLYANYALVTGQ